jgi:membrane protease YdiL (CAAX protease family)
MLSRSAVDRDELTALAVATFAATSLSLFGESDRARWPGVGLCLLSALALLTLLIPSAQHRLRSAIAARPALRWGVPVAFAIYGGSATLLLGSGGWLPVVAWPALVLVAWSSAGDGVTDTAPWRMLLAALALALLAGLWDPSLQIRVPGDARLGLAYITSIAIALYLFVVVGRTPAFDVRLGLRGGDVAIALAATAVLALVAVPLGLALGFLRWDPRWLGPEYALARVFGLTLFVGLPEELLFRGVVQTSFIRLTSRRAGWVLASVAFGLLHLAKHAPHLNWPYAVLATGAGLAYGWVYLRTGRIGAAALSHGLVNWMWGTWLGA